METKIINQILKMILLCFGFFMGTLALPSNTLAALIKVTTTDDTLVVDGKCSLREEIRNANQDTQVDNKDCKAGSGDDVIDVSPGIYLFSLAGTDEDDSATGDLDIKSNIEIHGNHGGSTVIDGNGLDTVFHIKENTDVKLCNLTISNGSWGIVYDGSLTLDGSALTLEKSIVSWNAEGGIYSEGILTLSNSTVSNNAAHQGGIVSGVIGILTLTNSTVSNNSGLSGGIRNEGDLLTLSNSTVSNNTATERNEAGGITNVGKTAFMMTNSTVSNNTGPDIGGIYFSTSYASTAIIKNSTIAFNSPFGLTNESSESESHHLDIDVENTVIADNGSGDCENGTIDTISYSLVETTGCTFTSSTGLLTGVDPKLASNLDLNGGTTRTHKLESTSPAIDAGDPAGCKDADGNVLTTDQRGKPRPFDGDGDGTAVCDMGAYERQR